MNEASKSFRDGLAFVESTLGQQMAYLTNVCVGTPHQGSTLASHQKMALAEQCEHSLHSEMVKIRQLHWPKEADKTPLPDSLLDDMPREEDFPLVHIKNEN